MVESAPSFRPGCRVARMAEAPGRRAQDSSLATAAILVAIVVASSASSLSGLFAGTGSKVEFVLPLAAVMGVGLAILALTRFSAFVFVVLVVRASLDLTKVSTSSDRLSAALDPSTLLGVLFLVAATLWLAAQHHRYGSLAESSLRRPLLLLIAAGSLSIVGSADRADSSLEALRILDAVLMFVVLEHLMATHLSMTRFLRAVFLSTLFPLAFTAAGILAGAPRGEEQGALVRLVGPFNQSNTFGRYLMLVIVFGAALWPYLERNHQRLLGIIMSGCGVFLVLTYTRSAIIATVLGLVVVGLLQSKRLLVTLVAVGAVAVALAPPLTGRFTELVGSGSDPDARNTLEWRFEYWGEIIPLANSNPVTGIGLDRIDDSTEEEKQSHNDFMRAYVETGLIGLLAYLGVLVAIIRLGLRAARTAPAGSLDRGVGVGFLGCGTAFIAVSAVANVMSNVVVLWYFLAFAAAASSVARRNASGASARSSVESPDEYSGAGSGRSGTIGDSSGG
jgi:putative inorganic carbon (HCO3(-)) transporter